jgi:hypothetical protein
MLSQRLCGLCGVNTFCNGVTFKRATHISATRIATFLHGTLRCWLAREIY